MTVVTLSTADDHADISAPPPVPWRRMTWVIWRQHRGAFGGAVLLLAVIGTYLWFTGDQLHTAYTTAITCHPAASVVCGSDVRAFNAIGSLIANGYALQIVPALIGAFIGAPLLARDIETGTFRFIWTQGIGRWRWTLAKLTALALGVTAAAVALSVVLSWYYQPYFSAANQRLGLNDAASLSPGLFDLRGATFAAWTLAAFAIGALAGMAIRRVVPAILAALVAYTALAATAGALLRAHYLTPIRSKALQIPDTTWMLTQHWYSANGRPVGDAVLSAVLRRGGPRLAGKGGVPQSLDTWRYLANHGYTRWSTYQPASRFWHFQAIETSWLIALAVLLLATTIWIVQRRAV